MNMLTRSTLRIYVLLVLLAGMLHAHYYVFVSSCMLRARRSTYAHNGYTLVMATCAAVCVRYTSFSVIRCTAVTRACRDTCTLVYVCGYMVAMRGRARRDAFALTYVSGKGPWYERVGNVRVHVDMFVAHQWCAIEGCMCSKCVT